MSDEENRYRDDEEDAGASIAPIPPVEYVAKKDRKGKGTPSGADPTPWDT